MPGKRIKIVIADDHDFVRSGLVSLIESTAEFGVVGEATDATSALKLVADRRPEIAILDISMPGMSGVDAVKSLRSKIPALKILILSMHADDAHMAACLAAGADGYVVKSADKKEIVRALRTVVSGKQFFQQRIHEDRPAADAAPSPEEDAQEPLLTRREREVLQYISRGLTNKQIAGVLSLSPNTINTHRANIMQKLEKHDTAGLVRYALEKGLG
jgi:DNA-binding NarL/FixJ family response regulator